MVKNRAEFLRGFRKSVIPAEAGIQEHGSPIKAFGDDSMNNVITGMLLAGFAGCLFLAGCSAPVNGTIPSIPRNHPANRFYDAAQQGMLADKVCRDNRGDPTIPIGKIQSGQGYTKSQEIVPGVFFFRDDATGKIYLGVSFLQYSGFLQIPKVCAWEEKK